MLEAAMPGLRACSGSELTSRRSARCEHCKIRRSATRSARARTTPRPLPRKAMRSACGSSMCSNAPRTGQGATKVAIAAGFAVAVLAVGLATSLWLWRRAETERIRRQIQPLPQRACSPPPTPVWNPDRDPAHVSVPGVRRYRDKKLDRNLGLQPAARARAGLRHRHAPIQSRTWHRTPRLVRPVPMHATTCPADAPLQLLKIKQQLRVRHPTIAVTPGAAVYADLLPRLRASPAGPGLRPSPRLVAACCCTGNRQLRAGARGLRIWCGCDGSTLTDCRTLRSSGGWEFAHLYDGTSTAK